jgi:hypothetical protein
MPPDSSAARLRRRENQGRFPAIRAVGACVWCASARLRPEIGAVGDGPTAEAAVADLRDALEVLAEVGRPDELTLTLGVA